MVAIILMLALVFSVGYLIHLGNTDSWPEATCAVDGNRVVREYIADRGRAIVMYRGEYHLRYAVSGHDYYLWANSGWSDVDRQFIQDKVDNLPDTCDLLTRYNPHNPSNAIAVRK